MPIIVNIHSWLKTADYVEKFSIVLKLSFFVALGDGFVLIPIYARQSFLINDFEGTAL